MVQCLVAMTFLSVQIWQRQLKLPEGWFGNFGNFRSLKYSPKYFEFGNSVVVDMVQCLVAMTFSSVQIWQRQLKLPEGWFGNFGNFRNLKYSPKYFEFGNSVTFVLRASYSMRDPSLESTSVKEQECMSQLHPTLNIIISINCTPSACIYGGVQGTC